MSYHRQRFDEDDRDHDPWEYEDEPKPSAPSTAPAEEVTETIAGQDSTGAVTVNVTPEADIVSVKLDAGWKNTVDPRSLHTSVLSAANAATAQVLAKRVEQMEDPSTVATDQPAPPTSEAGTPDETPKGTDSSPSKTSRSNLVNH